MNISIFIVLFLTFALSIIILFCTPETPLWCFVQNTLLISVVFLPLIGLIKSPKQNSTGFTLTGDAFITGTIFMITAFSKPDYYLFCILLCCIPFVDIIRFLLKKKRINRVYPTKEGSKWLEYIAISLTIITFIIIVAFNFRHPSLTDIVLLSLSGIAFIAGCYLMVSESISQIIGIEKFLPMTAITAPIAMCSPEIYRLVGNEKFKYLVILAVVMVIIISLDTLRFTIHYKK